MKERKNIMENEKSMCLTCQRPTYIRQGYSNGSHLMVCPYLNKIDKHDKDRKTCVEKVIKCKGYKKVK